MSENGTDKPPHVAVAIVDAHCLLREAIGTWLERWCGIRVVWTGATYEELEAALAAGLKVDLVLVGLGVGEDAGFDVLRSLAEERPRLKCAAYMHRHDEATMLLAYRIGALALLHGAVPGDAVCSALKTVMVGGVFHSPVSQGLLMKNPDGLTQVERNRERLRKQLTAKELEVLELLVRFPGYS